MRPNHEMLERLYTEAAPVWFGIAARLLPSKRDQEDAVHEAFFKSLRREAPFTDLDHARKYLNVAVHHASIDLARKLAFLGKQIHMEEVSSLDSRRALTPFSFRRAYRRSTA